MSNIRSNPLYLEMGEEIWEVPSPERYHCFRWSFYLQSNKTCALCGHHVSFEDMNLDHIKPLVLDGKHTLSNLQLTHEKCNKRKNSIYDRIRWTRMKFYLQKREAANAIKSNQRQTGQRDNKATEGIGQEMG